MDYSHLFRQAGQITWRYKFLWIFGIMMALCGQGSGGRPRFQMNTRMPVGSSMEMPDFPSFFPEPLGDTPLTVYLLIMILLTVVFGTISIVIGALGRSALIKAVDRAETDEAVSFGESWRDGLAKVVPVSLLQALLYAPLLAVGLIVFAVGVSQFWPFFSQIAQYRPTPGSSQEPPPFLDDFLTLFPLFFVSICSVVCFFFIMQIFISLFVTLGSRAIVLEDQGVFDSLARSWSLFRQNKGPTIILAVAIFIMTIVIGLLLTIPAMIIMFPIMMSSMPDMLSESGPSLTDYGVLVGTGLVLTVIFSLVNGVVQVFIEALWTLAYREFIGASNS